MLEEVGKRETEEADFYPEEMKVEGTASATLEQHAMGEMNK